MNEASIENTLKDISKTLKAIQKDLHKLTLQDAPKQVKEDKKEPDEMIFFPAALLPDLKKDVNNHFITVDMVVYTVKDLKTFLNLEAHARKLRMTEKYFKPDDNKRFWDKMPEFMFVNSEEVAINLATAERIE